MKKNLQFQRGLSLVAVALFSMLIALLGMGLLYAIRYERIPFQESFNRWAKAGKNIALEVKQASGVQNINSNSSAPVAQDANTPAPVTVSSGVRRCVINGKTVYSDSECNGNATATTVKLHDTAGFVQPKPASKEETSDSDMRLKMLDKLIEGSAKK